ncbi:MAG: 4-hydroxy-3-methylbut-2-enyl diphosphate reductase, partial [Burkholderiales bacterium]
PDRLAYVTQTTLSVDDTAAIIAKLKQRFPTIIGPDLRDICYATQNRQNAVRELAKMVDVILVIGAINSSNSNRLRDLGQEMGVASYLINGANDIKNSWLKNVNTVGITAGASAPEILVEEVVNYLQTRYQAFATTMEGVAENIKFKLPKKIA